MRRFILSLAVVLTLFAAQQSMAVDVRVSLEHSGPGAFDVFLSTSGPTKGIVSYGVPVTGAFDSLDHNSPNTGFAQDAALVGGSAGFWFLRSADGTALLGASQDTIFPTTHLIDGFGLSAGSFAGLGLNPLAGTPDGDSWDSPLRIASGTYSGAPPMLDLSLTGGAFVNVFLLDGSIEAAALGCAGHPNSAFCPEPTTIALASLGMIGLLGSQRRHR